ncbi:MAG: right-handed parallel beta-helix repeat-containing protein [Parvularculaceae bacterium]
MRYRLALLGASLLAWSSSALAADVNVSSPGALSAALGAATPGDRILLAPGRYGAVDLRSVHFSEAVTIASADMRDPAVLSSVYLNDVGGLSLESLRVEYGSTRSPLSEYAVNILGGADLSMDGLEISSAVNGAPDDDAYGINIRNSKRLKVRNSRIHDVFRAIAVFDSEDVAIDRNQISAVASDGVVARGAVRLSIVDNYFSDFRIVNPQVHHPDAIQLWSRHARRANQDVVIRGNLIRRGVGDRSQGIFVKTPEIATVNLLIEENVIEQSMGQGIYVENGNRVIIRNNSVLPQDYRVDQPGIEVRESAENVTVENNLAAAFRVADGVAQSGNIAIDYFNPWIDTFVGNHIAAPAKPVRAEDFAALTAAGAKDFVMDLWAGAPLSPTASLTPTALVTDLDFSDGVSDRAPDPAALSEIVDETGARYYMSEPTRALTAALNLSIAARARFSSAAAGWRLIAAVPGSYEVRVDRNRIRFSVWTQNGVTRLDGVSAALLDGAAHDIALHYDGASGAMRISVDGVEIAQGLAPRGPIAYHPTRRLYVAGAPWGLFFGDGIERLRISR